MRITCSHHVPDPRYAVAAFEQGALDYVLKPLSRERMQVTVERLRSRLADPPADLHRIAELIRDMAPAEARYLRWLTVPQGAELRVIAVRRSAICARTTSTPPWSCLAAASS